MIPIKGLLENWRYALGIFLFCSYVSVASWLRLARYARFPHDPVTVFGLAAVIFITASISYRSRFAADRVVFGSATAAFVLMGVRMAPLNQHAMSLVEAVEGLLWTIAAAVCLVVLLRYFMPSPRDNYSRK